MGRGSSGPGPVRRPARSVAASSPRRRSPAPAAPAPSKKRARHAPRAARPPPAKRARAAPKAEADDDAGSSGSGDDGTESDENDDHCATCGLESGRLLMCEGCPLSFHLACAGLKQVPLGAWQCHECLREMSADSEEARLHDDECFVCRGRGSLMCCDTCPCAFHLACAGMAGVPADDWSCPACELAGVYARARHVRVAPGVVVDRSGARVFEVDGVVLTAYRLPPKKASAAHSAAADRVAAEAAAIRAQLELPPHAFLSAPPHEPTRLG